jgi:bacillolysin
MSKQLPFKSAIIASMLLTLPFFNVKAAPSNEEAILKAPAYCPSKGTSSQWNKEWIQSVKLGSINNNSGNNGGYADFTVQSTNLSKGSTNAISIVPGIELFTFFDQTVRVWIDYNQNGVFDNAELVFSQTKSSVNDAPFTGSIVVPASALNGRTRMRVSRQRNGIPPACGTFADGEVEDYSVNIVGIAPTEKLEVNVFPIPAANELTVEMTMPEQGDYKITLTSQCGTEVFNNLKKSSGKNVKTQIPVSHLERGIYQVKVQTKEGTFEKRIVVE